MARPRVDEILDRLAEIRLAMPGLAERSPSALRYLAREVDDLLSECAEWSGLWSAALEQSRSLADDLRRAREAAAASEDAGVADGTPGADATAAGGETAVGEGPAGAERHDRTKD